MTTPRTPEDPDFAARVAASFARQGVMAHLGARLIEVQPGACAVALPFRPELAQQDGFFHAGVVTTIADSACGYAAFSLMPVGARVLTVELKINLMSPAAGSLAVARGVVLRAGRSLTVARADVHVEGGREEAPVATMLATLMCLRPRA
jgi:uncharacterized protein (TIGR00369 family)